MQEIPKSSEMPRYKYLSEAYGRAHELLAALNELLED